MNKKVDVRVGEGGRQIWVKEDVETIRLRIQN